MNGVIDQALAYTANQIGKSGSSWESVYSNYCRVKKKNNIVFVKGESSDFGLTAGQYIVIAALPEGYRPEEVIYFTAGARGGSAVIFGRIETDGVLYLYTNTSTSYWTYSFSFPL